MSDSYNSNRRQEDNIKWESLNVPEDYVKNPRNAKPVLENLLMDREGEGGGRKVALETLMHAADLDIELHQTRQKAVLQNDPSILSSASSSSNQQQQQNRKTDSDKKQQENEYQEYKQLLSERAPDILSALDMGPSRQQMTQPEVAQERLGRWQEALELYVHLPHVSKIDLLGLLEKLCVKCNEEEELLDALSEASDMCLSLVESTSQSVKDASERVLGVEEEYRIKLEAHHLYAQQSLEDACEIEDSFVTHGRAAMHIGQQLERAEIKRRQCQGAALLLRRWWTMENLAEQEEISGMEVKVVDEIRGVVNQSSCRMDPLFTRRENGLEAANALKQLRLVVKCRGTGSDAGGVSSGGMLTDAASLRRFELTRKLIMRTGEALEHRLLNDFSMIFGKGGSYDFTTSGGRIRAGALDWIQLRELAKALMSFENGRNLFKRYVDLVVTTKFPELFDKDFMIPEEETLNPDGNYESDSDKSVDLDMDATRSRLSQLFHRVSEVCEAEFELIAHVFGSSTIEKTSENNRVSYVPDPVPLQVARLLLQRVISDSQNGLQARINDLLTTIDRRSDFDAGLKKLDTFVVIHEKAAGLFCLLKEAAEQSLIPSHHNNYHNTTTNNKNEKGDAPEKSKAIAMATSRASSSLVQFLTSQEMSLLDGYRRGYLNLELRLLHHQCCEGFSRISAKMLPPKDDPSESEMMRNSSSTGGSQIEYKAPYMPLDTEEICKGGLGVLLDGLLKGGVIRQPVIDATDSLARARLMFGAGNSSSGGGFDVDSTARVVTAIYSQMCTFYGDCYLFPIMSALKEMLEVPVPSNPPSLPFDESKPAYDLGIDGKFWVCIDRVNSAAKAFDRELWAEQRAGSSRVWEILVGTGSQTSLNIVRERRLRLFRELEERGDGVMMRALDTLSRHAHWIMVMGGESYLGTGGRIIQNLTGTGGFGTGPYAIPTQSSLEASNSPAVKSLTFCLRAQFGNVQAALTSQSLSAFWTALSMRIYDILVAQLLQHYSVSTVGAAILSRDVEALRMVAMLAGTNHSHWDSLKELLTLYMTPPEALKVILAGLPGENKGLFYHSGREKSLVFVSRRTDFRVKTNAGWKKSPWAVGLFRDLGVVKDPTEGPVNIALYAAERKTNNK